MRTLEKHDAKSLAQMTKYESDHLLLQGHLRSFHAYWPNDDSLAKLKKLHAEAHSK